MPGLITHEDIAPHRDAVEPHHVHPKVTFRGDTWDLSHLEPFPMLDVKTDAGQRCVVIVRFSCHCFTISQKRDGRAAIPADELYSDGREKIPRVLCPTRYELSRRYLPQLIKDLPERHIQVTGNGWHFMTMENLLGAEGAPYLVFFETQKDRRRKGRVLLRVQTAYVPDALSKRLKAARKARFPVLLRKTLEETPFGG